MAASNNEKTCFVIMPFGQKSDIGGEVIDFDKVYRYIIKKAIEGLGITCIRCDEIGEAGWIHEDMIEHIYEDEVAVVDISTLNANVFFELGVRHALKSAVTVLIQKKGTPAPFNVQGFRVIEYDPSDLESVDLAQTEIADFVRNGLDNPDKNDSIVYAVLDDLRVARGDSQSKEKATRLTRCETFEYELKRTPHKKVGLITGDIRNIKIIDIWVNSENTDMQMARYYDRSISGLIRFLGAKRDIAGHVAEDVIADELAAIMGHYKSVPPATVIPTGSGELARSHNVKKIFHAASVSGALGDGYSPIKNIESCVTNALAKADADEFKEAGLKTILFPLMGTGTAGASLQESAQCLIEAAVRYLEANPDSTIECAYFLVSTDVKLQTCQAVLQEMDGVAT